MQGGTSADRTRAYQREYMRGYTKRPPNPVPFTKSATGNKPFYEPKENERIIVKLSAALGYRPEVIAAQLNNGHGINVKTLRKHFRKELESGAYEASLKVGGGVLDLAMNSPDPHIRCKASFFWLERRAGWTPTVKHSGADGGAMQIVVRGPLAGE